MATGKTLQSTIEISGVLSPSLQAVIDKAVDRLSEMAEETLETADAASRLVAEMSVQEDVLKTMQKAYAGYVANGEESSEQAQDLADRIRTVSGELEDNRDVLKAAEKAAQKLTDAQDDTGDAFTKLEKKINSQEDELAALRRQYSNVALEQGENSDEARKLATKISDLSGELRQNKQRLDDAEKAAKSFGESLESAGEKAEKSSDGYTIMKDVIADLATDAIQNAIESFKDLALEGDKALAMLQARTGKTAEEMEDYDKIVRDIYNSNYGESISDVSEKLSIVIQMTDDLDNASLKKVTKNAIALEDVFGFDTVESLRAAKSLTDQFGLSSEEAFNLIVQGAQRGLNQNGDLLDTINEYSVQFRTAGYSADDMFNMLANGAETGTWSVDKLGDAVKEFNIRMSDGTAKDYLEDLGLNADSVMKQFNKGGPEAQKAIKKVMDAVLKCDDATLQYQAGVGLFGTMWEDLGADTVASLMDTQGAIDKTKTAMENVDTTAYDTLSDKLGGITRKFQGAGNAILATGGTALYAAMNWDTLVEKLGAAKVGFGKMGSSIASAISSIPPQAWLVIAAIALIVGAITYLWKSSEDFREGITGIWNEIKGHFTEFGETITNKLNELGFDFESFGEVIASIWKIYCDFFGPYIEQTFQSISNTIGFVLDVIVGLFDIFAGIFTLDFERVWEGIKGILVAVWDYIVNTIKNKLNFLTSWADVILGWFGTSWEEVWGSIKTFFVDTWNSIASFFSGIWDKIASFCSSAWDKIKNVVQFGILFIKNLLSAAFQIITLPFRFIWENCKDTVISIWEKIKNAVGNAITAVKEKLGAVLSVIKAVFSVAWEYIRSNTVEKFSAIYNAIKNKFEAARERLSSVVGVIKNVLGVAWEHIRSNTVDRFSAIYNAIKDKLEAARNKVKSLIDKIKSYFNFSWSLPKLKLPHVKIKGEFSLDPPAVPKFSIDWYKDGGILTKPTVFGASGNTLLAGGEAGAEAVLPLRVLWDKMETMFRNVLSGTTSPTLEVPDGGLTAKAGQLLTLDDFSLGSLAEGSNVVYYYDFSNFTWSPEIHMEGGTSDEDADDDFMAKLKAHEAEFFEWLDEFVRAREEAQYA